MSASAEFDRYAAEYDVALAQGLAVSGENKEYFARGRIAHLAVCLKQVAPDQAFENVLDFGCGTGTATPFLLELLAVQRVLGVDVSAASLAVARRDYAECAARFLALDEYSAHADMDLAFCNGVFHHIVPEARLEAARRVLDALRPGGWFAFWENNPWNPGTQIVMKRCPFDRDAQTLSPPAARALLRAAGFETVRTDFLFLFPSALKALRVIEPRVAHWPLGAQYQVLCRKPTV
jgi:trans-aconitate methyltransferase